MFCVGVCLLTSRKPLLSHFFSLCAYPVKWSMEQTVSNSLIVQDGSIIELARQSLDTQEEQGVADEQ